MGSDKSYLELPEDMLRDLGDDMSLARMDTWWAHRLYRVCPNQNCEWCATARERMEQK